jgi:hypothetical protein
MKTSEIKEFIEYVSGIEVIRANTTGQPPKKPYISWNIVAEVPVANAKKDYQDLNATQLTEIILTPKEYTVSLNFYTSSKKSDGARARERVEEFIDKFSLDSVQMKLHEYDFTVMRTGTPQNLDSYTGKEWEKREQIDIFIYSQSGVTDSISFIDQDQELILAPIYEEQ